jgi:hypothetical protein
MEEKTIGDDASVLIAKDCHEHPGDRRDHHAGKVLPQWMRDGQTQGVLLGFDDHRLTVAVTEKQKQGRSGEFGRHRQGGRIWRGGVGREVQVGGPAEDSVLRTDGGQPSLPSAQGSQAAGHAGGV